MGWYQVVKTVKCHRYLYWQTSWREGGKVKTKSRYIGPANGWRPVPKIPSSAATLSLPFAPAAESRFDPGVVERAFQDLTAEDARSAHWEHHWVAGRKGPTYVRKIPRVEAVINTLLVKWTHNTSGCYYRPGTGQVNIPPLKAFIDKNGQTATQAYYVVTFHELIHWTGDLGRIKRTKFRDYPVEELVAELGAVMLMRHFGLDIGNNQRHARYFQKWLDRSGGSHAETLANVKIEAERAVRYIIDGGKLPS